MSETKQTPPESAAIAAKLSASSFSIWPPSERTRDAVRNRLIETLSTPSILSKKYGTVSREEAVEASKRIEEEAYVAAGQTANTDGGGVEILQVYSNDISKKMLDTVKARSGQSVATETPPVDETAVNTEEGDDGAGSSAPPQSEKVDSVAGEE